MKQLTPDLIGLHVRGFSPSTAQRYAEATVDYLLRVHGTLAIESIAQLKQQALTINKQLTKVQQYREKLLQTMSPLLDDAMDGKISEHIMLSDMLNRLDAELRSLTQKSEMYEERIGSGYTYPTSLLENISVGDKPVWPNTVLFAAFSGIAALLLGIVGAFLIDAIRTAVKPGVLRPD